MMRRIVFRQLKTEAFGELPVRCVPAPGFGLIYERLAETFFQDVTR